MLLFKEVFQKLLCRDCRSKWQPAKKKHKCQCSCPLFLPVLLFVYKVAVCPHLSLHIIEKCSLCPSLGCSPLKEQTQWSCTEIWPSNCHICDIKTFQSTLNVTLPWLLNVASIKYSFFSRLWCFFYDKQTSMHHFHALVSKCFQMQEIIMQGP